MLKPSPVSPLCLARFEWWPGSRVGTRRLPPPPGPSSPGPTAGSRNLAEGRQVDFPRKGKEGTRAEDHRKCLAPNISSSHGVSGLLFSCADQLSSCLYHAVVVNQLEIWHVVFNPCSSEDLFITKSKKKNFTQHRGWRMS